MRAATLPLLLALLATLLLAASGYGARFGAWDYRFGFQLLRFSLYAGLASAGLALVFMLIPRARSGRMAVLVVAAAIGAGVAWFPWSWLQSARAVPAINDITTDPDNPPTFVAIIARRAGAPVPIAYPGAEVAAAQRRAYPDLRPLELAVPPATAFARALDVVRLEGWDIAAADAAAGRIEATATTPWFGFRDDVVIRVTPVPVGSRIDVRSVSRVGRSDLGTNARRIRGYLARLAG